MIEPWMIALLVILFGTFTAFVVQRVALAHHRQISAGKENLVGRTAEVRVTLDPKGTVFVEDEYWTAISEEGRVEPGEEVIITKVEGLKLYTVKKNKKKEENL